ncbi:uncharacterized protein LOC107036937 [Diachasma alloeum]|uniref:uncharacterized protein LOC107036937 n=1 Tax=Diachasma alloeum TaxID=454923 RepID=UPI0007381159|nr:uncharacterized protein LOC107036937 [Diachasma alloeum]
MKVHLLLAVIAVSVTLGQSLKCYYSLESKGLRTARTEISCDTECVTTVATTDDGIQLRIRACLDMYEQLTEPVFLTQLSPRQQEFIETLSFGRIRKCSEDLCNKDY